jgi:hypothetical protein
VPFSTETAPGPHWQPRLAQPFVHALAAFEVDGIVAERLGSESSDSEARIEFEPGAHLVMRLFYAAKTSRSGGEQEMRHREVRIVLDRPPEPTDRLLIAPRPQLRETDYLKPTARAPVAWT